MTEYLIREGEDCAELIEACGLKCAQKGDAPDDPMVIVKRFEAVCWCAAKKVYAEHQGHDDFDMSMDICDINAQGAGICSHYYEVKNEKR